MLQSSIGLPASATNAFGPPDPSRSPRPAATTSATAVAGIAEGRLGLNSSRLSEQPVEVLLSLLLIHVERVHQLG